MAIHNDDELLAIITRVNSDIQAIQNYVGKEPNDPARIKFPYGFIRKAEHFRKQYSYLNDTTLIRNIAYSLILTDVFHWLLLRTTLSGTAKEMIIKEGICLCGSLCESITKDILTGKVSKKAGYKDRTKYLLEHDIIDDALKIELDWLWDVRNNEHLFLVAIREHEHYKIGDYNRAIRTLHGLRDSLEIHFIPF